MSAGAKGAFFGAIGASVTQGAAGLSSRCAPDLTRLVRASLERTNFQFSKRHPGLNRIFEEPFRVGSRVGQNIRPYFDTLKRPLLNKRGSLAGRNWNFVDEVTEDLIILESREAIRAARLAPKSGLTPASRLAQNQTIGNAARDRIAARFPGSRTEVTLPTTIGNNRRIDVLTQEGFAIESKVGRTSLTPEIRTQVLKDVELLNDPLQPVHSLQWEFSRSPVTNKIGPTRPLENFLREQNIQILIND